MHNSHNSFIYLHSTSHPIIEDCDTLIFAPYPRSPLLPDHKGENKWDKVHDFKWLKQHASPNWKAVNDHLRALMSDFKDDEERMIECIMNCQGVPDKVLGKFHF